MQVQRLALCGLALAFAFPAAAQDRCGGRQPLVARSETARAIFLAVERDYAPWGPKRFPTLDIEDEGDAWRVGRSNPLPKQRNGSTITVRGGGGQLSMRIAKCDGAISEAYFAR